MTVITTESLRTRQACYDRVNWDAVEPYQIEVREDILKLLPPDTRSVLDLGCGNGIIANALPAELTVIGVDISIAALTRLRRSACAASALQLPFADRTFDLVMTNDVIEHLPDEEFSTALREIERVAKRHIVTTVPFAENLGALVEYSGPLAAPHHINDHFRSFKLDTLKGLYKDFELDSVVFSGAEWQYETPPTEAFIALVKELQGTQAAQDPSPIVLTNENVATLLQMLRAQQARDLGRNPEIFEFLQLRTEAICLYRRRDDGQRPVRHAIRTGSKAADAVPVAAANLNLIDFGKLERHLQSLLPTMARFPYVITPAAISRAPGGTLFTPNDKTGSCEIKFGFFCNSEGQGKLRIVGNAATGAMLTIAHYGSNHDYRLIARETVFGNFELALTDLDLSHSQYGMLFSITVSAGTLLLRSVLLSTDQQPAHRLVYTKAPEYLSVKYGAADCFLSCRLYGEDVPVLPWFKSPTSLPSIAALQQSARGRVASEIGMVARLAAFLGNSVDGIIARQESELRRNHAAQQRLFQEAGRQQEGNERRFEGLRRELEETRLAQQRLFQEAGRQQEGNERRFEGLRRELEETRLAQQRLLEEQASRQREETGRQLAELKRQIQEDASRQREEIERQFAELKHQLQNIDKVQDSFIEKTHRLGEAVVRLELGDEQLSRRIHIIERVLSPVIPAARYVNRMRRAVGRRLVSRRLPPIQEWKPAAQPSPSRAVSIPATARHERTAVMLVADDRIDRRVLAQARSLVLQGWRVTVVAVPYPGPVDLDQEAFPELWISRIDTSRPPPPFDKPRSTRLSPTRNWIEAYFYHDHFLERALQHPAAIVTAHDLPVLPAAIAAAESCGARIVYDAHELYPEQHHFGPELTALYREVESEVVGFADAVTTVNLSIAQEMAERYGIPVPQVVLNAPEIDRERLPIPRGNMIREKLQLPESRRILLFQGTLSLNRNLENLVRAMAHVRTSDVALVFLGPGVEKRAELSGIAAGNSTLGTSVFFLDPVDHRLLLGYTASADVGIIPYPPIDLNSRLCTPNKLFEFIVACVPILANDLPELRRFVSHNEFGQVHPLTDPEAIAAAIDAMFASDLAAYRRNLRARCHEFTWEQQEGTITGLYERLFAELQATERQ